MNKTQCNTLEPNLLVVLSAILGLITILCMSNPVFAATKYVEQTMAKGKKGVIPINSEGLVEVPVSNTQINRIVSDQEIHSVQKPDTKKIVVTQAAGNAHNAFLNVKGTKSETIYIVTESAVYTVKLKPTNIRPQTLHLVYEKKEKVVLPLIGNEREKVAVKLIKAAFKEGPLLEQARTTSLHEKKKLLKDIDIRAYRRYEWDEDGLNVTLYVIRLNKRANLDKLDISEKMFLIPELCAEPLGIALSRDHLTKKDYTRLFIVGRN